MIVAPVEPRSELPDGAFAVAQVLLDGVALCAYVKDRGGVYRAANASLCAWLDRPVEAILGRTDADLVPPWLARGYAADDDRVLEGLRLDKEEPRMRDSRVLQVRSVRQPLFESRPALRSDGAVTGVLGLFWEAQPLANEEERRAAHRLELGGRLVGGVVHDFNNLLASLQIGLALLAEVPTRRAPPTHSVPSAEDVLQILRQVTEHTGRLTNQLHRFLRCRGPLREHVDLRQTAREVLSILSCIRHPSVVVDLQVEPALPPVLGDPGALAQVLFNLCLNACDAMPHGGHLRVEVRSETPAWAAERERQGRGGFVCLRVADTGEGIAPEIAPRIFDRFFTTRPPGKGSGLGLALVEEIVREHGGVIECATQVGLGTRFDVFLPALNEVPVVEDTPMPAAESVPPASPLAPSAPGQTLLLADNEPAIRLLVRMILQKNGYQVLLAENGQQAVDVYRQHLGEVSLVLLDRRMPVLSGDAAVRELAALDPSVRVVLLSGQTDENVPESLQGAVRGVLTKPFRAEQLLEAVRSALRS